MKNRRDFLKSGALAALGAAIPGCRKVEKPQMEAFTGPLDPLRAYPYRGWEDLYRKQWTWDKIVRSTHSANCTGSCSWNVYVRNGVMIREEQAADYPAAPDSGAVELDAMEELDPGRLARIVEDALAQFRDFELPQRVRDTGREAAAAADAQVEEAIAAEREEIEEIVSQASSIYERFRPRLEALAAEMEAELSPLDERLRVAQHAAQEKLEDLEPDLPELPEGEADPDDEGWLFDSRRSYMEQLDFYKGTNTTQEEE